MAAKTLGEAIVCQNWPHEEPALFKESVESGMSTSRVR
jgi:hypothetical protein